MDLKSKLLQKAVYWPRPTINKQGQKTFGVPIQIDCHWEDEQEIRIDKNGKEWMTKSKVYTDHPIVAEGVLWEGEFKDVTDRVTPFNNPDITTIAEVGKVPNLDADQKLFCAYL